MRIERDASSLAARMQIQRDVSSLAARMQIHAARRSRLSEIKG